MCITFSIIECVYWCLRVTWSNMFVDESSYVSFSRPSIFCIHFVVYFESETSDFLLGALCHCSFHITFIDDVTSFHVGFERTITLLRVLCFTIILVFCFWFIHFISPLVLFLQRPISRFTTLFVSSLHISLLVCFSSLPRYCYHIHIGHPRVHGLWDFLYMLHFIHEGMSFWSLDIWA